MLQNQSSVFVNGPTVNTFTLLAHADSAILQIDDDDADNHKVNTWSMMLLPYVLLLPYEVQYSIHTTTFKIKKYM